MSYFVNKKGRLVPDAETARAVARDNEEAQRRSRIMTELAERNRRHAARREEMAKWARVHDIYSWQREFGRDPFEPEEE